MGQVSADIQVNFGTRDQSGVLDVVVEDTGLVGDSPVKVAFSPDLTVKIISWEIAVWQGAKTGIPPILEVVEPGSRRIKIYCSQATAASLKVFVDNSSGSLTVSKPAWKKATVNPTANARDTQFGLARPANWKGTLETRTSEAGTGTASTTGRRGSAIKETLLWSGETRKTLRYNYDRPSATIMHRSTFFNRAGDRIPAPVYDQDAGAFFTQEEAFGFLVVEYHPGYTIVTVSYGNGWDMAEPGVFEAMQTAWARGDVTTAQIPPVQVLVISDSAAVLTSFRREFWPKGCPGVTITGLPGLDEESDSLTEIDGTRETATEKIYLDETDPSIFVEVEKITYFEAQDEETKRIMKLRMLNP